MERRIIMHAQMKRQTRIQTLGWASEREGHNEWSNETFNGADLINKIELSGIERSFWRRTEEEIETDKVFCLWHKMYYDFFYALIILCWCAQRIIFTVNWSKQTVRFVVHVCSTIAAKPTKITLDIWIISIFFLSQWIMFFVFSLFALRNGHCQVWQWHFGRM